MSWILDIVAVAVVVLMIVFGARRGFIKSAVRLIGVIAALVAAALISMPVAQWIYTAWIETPARETVATAAAQATVAAATTVTEQIAAVIAALPRLVQGAITATGVDAIGVSGAPLAVEKLTTLMMDAVIAPLCTSLMQAVLFLLIFIAVYIIARILAKAMDKVFSSLPIIRRVNALLGGVLGALEGVAFVYLLTLVLRLYMTMAGAGSFVTAADIEASYIVEFFVNFRLIGG